MADKDSIINRLKEDLFGPMADDELLMAYPTDVYLTGILFPQRTEVAREEDDQLQVEGFNDIESNDVSRDEVSLATVKRPASAGISFVLEALESPPCINIQISAGKYVWIRENPEVPEVDKEMELKFCWRRIPIRKEIKHISLDFSSKDYPAKITGIDGLGIHIRTGSWGTKLLVTVAAINNNRLGEEYERESYEENCFFQTEISVFPAGKTIFRERPIGGSAIDEDTQMASLIYREINEYAVGHTCSAEWEIDDKGRGFVKTSWLPRSNVKAMSSAGVEEFAPLADKENGPILSTRWLSEASGKKLSKGLSLLPKCYGDWLDKQKTLITSITDESLRNRAELHIQNAEKIKNRMEHAISLVGNEKKVEIAFRLANKAILLQRTWAKPDEPALVWYPFQLGFILLSLSSLADENHIDRNTADLLWFPTGGGKTEAYLGLIAFVLFFRRLRYGDRGAGVASFMRYTLRLLTVQQFQRAAALICACEILRNGEEVPSDIHIKFSNIPFSLGLWVGSETTPNTFDKALEALEDGNAQNRPDQLKYCPRHRSRRLQWIAHGKKREIHAHCPEEGCLWNRNSQNIPVWTVDEDIYRKCPTLVIGTIDKFAQVARKSETVSMFGMKSGYMQPDLIIQDELHLISGPLGTLAGLYEVAIDRLCTRDGIRPKIIASTATIRQAAFQIGSLFDRNTCLFPPPALDARNSGFAVIDENDPGREYIGVTTAGRSAKFTLQAVAASLLQSAGSHAVSDALRDDFWTLITYFNSLRELGGALVLMQDDVTHSLDEYAKRRKERARSIREPLELTSRVKSSEIKEILDELETPWNMDGSCDVLLASNMISVGVDVPRLGMMIVNGQPKSIAEYIQATSRVGRRRGGPGGLVVTLYNNAKARDRSHFETFNTWHSALYREVEATSVTPFAPRAREKALHAVLVILARHLIPELSKGVAKVDDYEARLKDFVDYIHDRAEKIDDKEADNTEILLLDFLETWVSNSDDYKFYWNDRFYSKSLLISAEKAAELRARYGSYHGRAMPTPNSMRNVEPGTLYKLEENLRDEG